MNNIAVVDMGSNAIRLLIASPLSAHRYETLDKIREPLRLGHDVFEKKLITEPTLDDLTKAFKKFRKHLEEHKVKKYWVVATSAMREATNQKKVIEKIQKESGLTIDVISGELEAQLVYEAVANSMNLNSARTMMLDIGGGSIEFTLSVKGKIEKSVSLPLGCVRLLKNAEKNKIKPDEIEPYVIEQLGQAKDFLSKSLPIDFAVGTGGNLDRMAKLKEIIFELSFASIISFQELTKIKNLVLSLSEEERIKVLHLRKDRADVIAPALIITHKMMELVKAQTLKIPQVGVKEGMILRLMQNKSPDFKI